MKNPIVFFTLLHFSMASVHIACAQIINTFPHTEDFEAFTLCSSNCAAACSLSGGWVNAAGDQTDWIVFSGATPTMNTGPDFDHTLGNSLGKYLYVESTGCTNATASLLSPSIDLSGQTNVSFDFWYHMYGNNLSTLHVDVSTDGGINFTDDMVPSWMANSNAWQKTTIPLDAYAGDTVIIRVRGVTGNGSLSDLAVDDFRFYIVQGNDAGIVRVDSPVNPLTPGLQNVVVTLQNFGTSVLTSAGIGWNVDGAAQTPYAWSGNLSTGQTETVTIGSYTFPAGISALKVWSYAPNGMTDEGPANDTVEYTLCTGLSGTYTIGGGGDFPGLLEAVSALVTCGISGAVTFNVLPGSGPFLQQLDIPQIAGASALNAIVFNGNGEEVRAGGSAFSRHVIRLNGAKHVTFDNFRITGADVTYAWGIHLMNQADSITIRNCIIDVSAAASSVSTNTGGIIASASTTAINTAGNNARNIRIENNTIIGGHQGIRIHGQNSSSQNNIISGNIIRSFYSYGIYLGDNDGTRVTGNDISRANLTSVGTFYGIFVDARNQRLVIENNRIHNTHDIAQSLTGAAYGIYFFNNDAPVGLENKVVNNIIYNFNGNGAVYGIYNSNSDGVYYYHNTISLDHAASTGGTTRGFYQTTSASNIIFKNNIVTVKRGGIGSRHCIYLATTTSAIVADFNVYYVDTISGNVGFWGGDFTTLADWQTANASAYDANSVFADPVYNDPASGNFSPTSVLVNNTGEGVGVSTDILGNPRSAMTPDAGAYEFSPPTNDASLSWVAPVPPAAAGNYAITVSLANSSLSQSIINTASLSYSDGNTPITQLFSGLNIAPGSSQTLSFSTPYNLNAFVTIAAYINTINGAAELIQTNDTAKRTLCPYLTGNFSINKTIPASATNFQSFNDAVSALSVCGINGAVTINVAANTGPYFEQVEILDIPGADAGSPVIFNGNDNIINFNPSSTKRYLVRLNGTDYVTLNDLNIIGTDTAYGWGVHLYNQAEHNTINNCEINLNIVTSTDGDNSAGIVASASATSVSAAGNAAAYTTVSNCVITGGITGIRLNGSTADKSSGNRITNNKIRDFYSHGIHLSQADSGMVSGNEISRPNRVNPGAFYGITLAAGCEKIEIDGNRIHDSHGGGTASIAPAYPIYFNDADAPAGKENKAVNNLIYNIRSQGRVYAIYNSSSDNMLCYHNTIVLDDSASAAADETRGFYQALTATHVDFRNNIVYITRGGTGEKHCLYYASPSSDITSDHNVLVMNAADGSNNYTAHYFTTDYTALTDWQASNGGLFDQNSSDDDPLFTDVSNGDFTPANPAINNMGTGVGVTADINQNPRSASTPDPGAIEFSQTGVDAAIMWVSPVSPVTPGLQTITVNISNTLSFTITDIVLSYTDGNIVVKESFGNLFITAGNNQNLSFSTMYDLTASTYLRAYIDSVNGNVDDDRANDTTAWQFLCIQLNGNYTINAGAPASATNFQSFNDALNALSCGISGSVVFDVVSGSGPYFEQISIPAISGASATNTVTFNGNINTLSFFPTTNERYVIRLDGAKHVNINDLRIVGSDLNYGFGILFSNRADSNTVNGCTIDVSAVSATQTTNSAGIVFSAQSNTTSGLGDNGSYNVISNNTVIGGYYGIRVNGYIPAYAVQNRIIGNSIRDFYAYGIYLQDASGTEIFENDISRPNRVNVTTFNGIYLSSGNLGTRIERNRIHNTHDNASNLTTASHAINFSNCDAPAGQENKVINNAIFNINNTGTIYGIFNTSSDGAFYYHNSISLDAADTTGGQMRGFYQTSFTDNIDFRNNIISIKRGGSGQKHCLYFATPTSNITCDYNIFYTTSDSLHFVGQFGANSYADLSSWQTVSGNAFDQNSLFAEPFFASTNTGNLTPLNSALDNKGTPLGIPVDINNAPRSLTTPDIGAFEFTPLLVDATVISLTEPGNLICGSPAIPVSAVISNFGFGTTSFTTVTAYVTGGTFFDTLSAVSTDSLSNGQTDTVHLGTINFISGGTLTFTVIAHTAGEGNPFNDTVIFSRQINASTAQPALLAYNDSICKGETTVISVDAMPNLDYTWFDVPAGGNAVFSGNPFTTPPLDSSVTYYVEASSPAKFTVGPADNAIGTGANFAGVGGQGLLFEVYRNLRLDSVSVYAFDTGTVYAELTDPSNLMVYNVTGVQVNTPGVKVTIPVGFNIAPGSYRIDANGSTTNGLYRNDSGATYPYTIPGLISITGSTFGLSSYFFFYDWKITATGCPSTRTAAPVHVSADSVVNAGFTYSIGGTGLDVTFDAADDRFSNTYDWDFGDGGSATSGTLTHQYANDGSYTACLTVENSCSQETNCQSFTVCGPFQNSFSSSAFGQTVSFQFNGTGVPASYLWDFGDGNNSTSASPTHTYQTAGTYTVTLISENFCSVSDTASATLIICTTVNAVFTATQVTPNGLAFDFVSFSTGNPASLTWDFGDGTFGTAPLISHTYNEHGSYTVRLIATDACGASDTMTQTVVTCLPADAAFTATVQSDGKSVTTVNNSSGTNLIYFWDFDDNFFSQLPEPSYTYSATGNYTITLIVVDPCGQSDTASQTISIIVGIQDAASGFNVSILPNPNDGDFLVQFTLEKQTEIRMRLWNIWGKAVYDNTAEFAAGKQSQKFSLKRLAKGIYVMELRNEEGAEMRRLAIE